MVWHPSPKLSHTAAMILQAIDAGDGYGFSVMGMTGLPSGTVYPAMRRLERDEPHPLAMGAAVDRRRRTASPEEVLQADAFGEDCAGSLAEALSAIGQADAVGGRAMTIQLAMLWCAARVVPALNGPNGWPSGTLNFGMSGK